MIAVAFLVTSLGLAGCGSNSDEAAEADKANGRANADAMAQEHSADSTDPTPIAEMEPAVEVITDTMPYSEYQDELVYGYFAAPADMFEPLPAVIMIHEWWGLNDNVRAMARRLAGEGYIVFAVDLYGGKTAETPTDARNLMLEVVEDPDSANANMRAAWEFVDSIGAPRIGSLGWCFGGAWSLKTAQLLPNELDAAVIYYGSVTAEEEQLEPITAPILGLFAEDDRGIPVDSVRAFDASMTNLGKTAEIHVYPGVGHAFANPTGDRYNAEAAKDAWAKTLEFLNLHLSTRSGG